MTVEQDNAAGADLADRITAVVDAYIDLLTNGTAEQIADLYASDATVEDPIGTDVRNTREQLVEFYSVITNMDERTATLKWKKVAGDTAVFEFTLVTGTSGMRFEITPVDIMVFDEAGKVSSMRAVWQASDLVQL
ncbi:nuclear transport factor 2 family protein [Gordonia sp. DT30]|uniref:nuclear transport factor 2 family protein n=1 Tax=Gordonia sp. DT30 TaxID=3416546 RepID=UPI003CEFA448